MRGEYNTRQKREMLRFLNNNALRNYSLDELSSAMREDGILAGKTTVYRFVETLAEQGRVRKYQSEQGAQYQYIEDDESCASHLHLMCRECGALYHVDCDLVGALTEHIKNDHDFALDALRTVLVGVCGKCAKIAEGSDTDAADKA